MDRGAGGAGAPAQRKEERRVVVGDRGERRRVVQAAAAAEREVRGTIWYGVRASLDEGPGAGRRRLGESEDADERLHGSLAHLFCVRNCSWIDCRLCKWMMLRTVLSVHPDPIANLLGV